METNAQMAHEYRKEAQSLKQQLKSLKISSEASNFQQQQEIARLREKLKETETAKSGKVASESVSEKSSRSKHAEETIVQLKVELQ